MKKLDKIVGKILKVDRRLPFEGEARFEHRSILDKEVAKFAWEHLKWRDRFDFRKVVSGALQGFAIIQEKDYKESDYIGWKFDFDQKV